MYVWGKYKYFPMHLKNAPFLDVETRRYNIDTDTSLFYT